MTKTFDNGIVQLHQADARALPLADQSVQCVVTSPPYWGLRDYGLEPSVWGGDPECQHDWAMESYQRRSNDGGDPGRKQTTNVGAVGRDELVHHAFCSLCSAWRGTLGLEPTADLYVQHLVEIFREVWRVMRPDATCWVNLGDSYATGTSAPSKPSVDVDVGYWQNSDKLGRNRIDGRSSGLKPKDLVGIPWRVAFALQADGWWLRSDIIWSKPNPMPESVTDRPTRAHEYLFLLTKAERYYYDQEAVREPHQHDGRKATKAPLSGKGMVNYAGADGHERWPNAGRNRRSVWTIATQPYPEAHFATFPEALVEPCILASTSERGACAECGAPWERVMEKHRRFESGSGKAGHLPVGKNGPNLQGGGETLDIRRGPVVDTQTTGWRPTCTQDADTVPCLVLDPFAGAGTVALVSQKLGRRAVGVDAKAEYLEMAAKRLSEITLPMEMR